MGEDKTRCEQCGWVGSDSLLIEVKYHDDADIMCPACQQVMMGEEPRLADWKALCLAAEAERDTLRAELATVKAALPKWRKDKNGYVLMLAKLKAAVVWDYGGGKWASLLVGGFNTDPDSHADRQAAMTAVPNALGLPPCEVVE